MQNNKETKTIAIYGAGFINKGAEAMILVVLEELSSRISEYDLNFAIEGSPQENDDIESIKAERIHRPHHSYNERWDRTWNRFLLRYSQNIKERYSNVDALINISGYAFGGNGTAKRAKRFEEAINAVKAKGLSATALPQAWGPFPQNKDEKAVNLMLSKLDLIYARDKHSLDFIQSIANKETSKRIRTCRDIAVCLKPESPERIDQILQPIGIAKKDNIAAICPNMRVYDRTPGKGENNSYLNILIDVITKLHTSNPNLKILLLPHELRYEGDPIFDDNYLCSLIRDSLEQQNIQTFVTEERLTSKDIKGIIGRCKVVASSRFHALMAALTQGVPGVAIGWSHKYHELLTEYGLSKYVFDYEKADADEIFTAIQSLLNEGPDLRAKLLTCSGEQRKQVGALFDELAANLVKNFSNT